jgi:uncharacterized delta-60 repeat protein
MAVALTVLMLAIGFVNPSPAIGQEQPGQTPGALDPSFGTGGIVTTSFAGGAFGQVLAQQSNGQLVVAGPGRLSSDLSSQTVTVGQVVRYNTNGSIDATFGNGGTATINNFFAFAIALQQNGQIVLAGTTENSNDFDNFGLVRLNTDGSTDTTFGGGLVSTSFTSGASNCAAFGVAIQPDGKIVAVGGAGINLTSSSSAAIGVARYNTDGSPDSQFGIGGQTTINIANSSALSVVIQADGAIVLAGEVGGMGNVFMFASSSEFLLARLTSTGGLDPTFGNGGIVETKAGSGSVAYQAALQPNGQIVVAGVASVAPTTAIALARYNTDGSLDTTFGSGGTVTTNFDGRYDSGISVAIQQDGRIVVGGTSIPPIVPETLVGLSIVVELSTLQIGSRIAVARYNPNGSLDTSFGAGGAVTTLVDGGSAAVSVIVQADGSIVAAGSSLTGVAADYVTANESQAFAVARYIGGPLLPGFTLAFSSPEITASPGTKTPVTVEIERTGGLTGKVDVTAPTSLPTGVIIEGPTSVNTKATSAEFTLKIKSSAPASTTQLTFTATDKSGGTSSATLTLVIP